MSRNPKGDVLSQWPFLLRPVGRVLSFSPFARRIWKELPYIPEDLRWLWYLIVGRSRFYATSKSRIHAMRQHMLARAVDYRPESAVTITFSSRKMGHRDNHIEALLRSFEEKTSHPERFEILVKIDDDDDIPFFYRLQNKFADLNLVIYVSPRGRGYYDMPHYDSFLIEQASPTSKAWLGLSDHGLFCRQDWDSDLLNLINRCKPFFAGSKPPKLQTCVVGPLPVTPKPGYFYDCEPFIIVSMNLIDGLRSATNDLDGWSLLGNSPAADTFLAGIDDVLRTKHHLNIYHQLDEYCIRRYRRVNWANNAQRSAAVSRVLEDFWEPATVETRSLIADRVYEHLTMTGSHA